MNYQKLIKNYIFPLFGPVNASLNYLREIDFKLDAQKISELLGALKTLEGYFVDNKNDEMQIKFCLHDFNECYEYFNIMLTQTMGQLNQEFNAKGLEGMKYFLKSGRDYFGFGGGSIDRSSRLLVKSITYSFYKMLSRFGKEVSTELINGKKHISVNTIKNVMGEMQDDNVNDSLAWGMMALYVLKKKKKLTAYPDFVNFEYTLAIERVGNQISWVEKAGAYFLMKQNVKPLLREALILLWFFHYIDALIYRIENNKELEGFTSAIPNKWDFDDIIK